MRFRTLLLVAGSLAATPLAATGPALADDWKLPPSFDPEAPDEDGDGWPDAEDNCLAAINVTQEDLDGDGLGDACDDDTDGDGVPDEQDLCPRTHDPFQLDPDRDRLGNACDPDDDDDGLPDRLEAELGANPALADTDGDGYDDLTEALAGSDPTRAEDYPAHLRPADAVLTSATGCGVAVVGPRGGPAALGFLAAAVLFLGRALRSGRRVRNVAFGCAAALIFLPVVSVASPTAGQPIAGAAARWDGLPGGARDGFDVFQLQAGFELLVGSVVLRGRDGGVVETAVAREWQGWLEAGFPVGDRVAVHFHAPYVIDRSVAAGYEDLAAPGLGDLTLRVMVHSRRSPDLEPDEPDVLAGSIGIWGTAPTGSLARLGGEGGWGGGVSASGEALGSFWSAVLNLSAELRHRGNPAVAYGLARLSTGLAVHTRGRGVLFAVQGFAGATTDPGWATSGILASFAGRIGFFSARVSVESDLAAMAPGAAPFRAELALAWSW